MSSPISSMTSHPTNSATSTAQTRQPLDGAPARPLITYRPHREPAPATPREEAILRVLRSKAARAGAGMAVAAGAVLLAVHAALPGATTEPMAAAAAVVLSF
ncbi:MAG: hypothetical protein JWO93_1650 [Micrococcaceae bacterium]|jgi:hypothetical protein|nr:hypothetical protein [Micrococcaceae bacterium]